METESKQLSRRLLVAVFAPVVLLLVLGGVLGAQILRMSEDAAWVDHTDEVISNLYRFQRELLSQESAVRGYLLTEDRVYLDQYFRSHPLDIVTHVHAITHDNVAQTRRMEILERRYIAWNEEHQRLVTGGDLVEARATATMLRRREELAAIRDLTNEATAEEEGLRVTRAAASAASQATTRTLFLVLFSGAALFLVFFSRRQLQAITGTYASALAGERATRTRLEDEAWVRTGDQLVSDAVQGDLAIGPLGDKVLGTLARYVGANVGAFFTADGANLKRRAGYALDSRAAGPEIFARGEGIVGQAAEGTEILRLADATALSDAGKDVPLVRAGTVERTPAELALVPLRVEGRGAGVVELGFLAAPSERVFTLLDLVAEKIAIAVRSADYRARLRELLEESQRQTEELQAQQEELRVANEELAEQTKAVKEASVRLEERQEELTTANARLEEQALDLETARGGAIEKAEALARASRYKSEFLANMSHELRTPLNSTLILAKLLGDNKDGNLTPEQIRFAQTIYGAGNDLLTLINDILDLSKIEAGRIDVTNADVPLTRVRDGLVRNFEPIANEKKVRFSVVIEPGAPEALVTDPQRLDQILKNLVSNALKFTEQGEVEVRIGLHQQRLRFAVRDTGIGIAPHQHEMVFEAFRQADGASNRKYGGTGLGLSISRDLARLLGGDLSVSSEVGKGSTFVLTLPRVAPAQPVQPGQAPATEPAPLPHHAPLPQRHTPPPPRRFERPAVEDDRDRLQRDRRCVLVVEDDTRFARILLDLAHERGFQCVVTSAADAGFVLATELLPSAIILDVNLPDHSGLSVLDRLKRNPATRHIPVHVISVGDYTQAALGMGAAAYLQKPVQREQLEGAFARLEERLASGVRKLLVVEDDATQRESMVRLLASEGVQSTAVGTAQEALGVLEKEQFDCIVMDLTLPDDPSTGLLEKISRRGELLPPVIVYTGRQLSEQEEQTLRRYSASIIVKGARSPERLLDEVTLFLHQVESKLPADRQKMLKQARDREAVFDGRTILVVEDDVRNIFALSSVLEPRGAKVVVARNGREALTALAADATIELVLMDIMMPEMDGLTATREIRKNATWQKLPIIALTAKAMKDDQERCLKAGANDYISKPLDVEMLLSLLRVWMPR